MNVLSFIRKRTLRHLGGYRADRVIRERLVRSGFLLLGLLGTHAIAMMVLEHLSAGDALISYARWAYSALGVVDPRRR